MFDLLLLSVDSGFATEEFHWREPKPCSEKVTRVLGKTNCLCYKNSFEEIKQEYQKPTEHKYLILIFFSAALIAEEKLENVTGLVLLLQRREEEMKEGFTVTYKDQDFIFVPEFLDRYG